MHPLVAACCSLGCALTWAFASVTFARVMRSHATVAPHALNLVKSVIAMPFFLLGCVVTGAGLPAIDAGFPWLVGSAVLGLLVADTGYFIALKALGPARGVLFIPLVPVATTVLAMVFLEEVLGVRAVLGVALTLLGVAVVLRDDKAGGARDAPAAHRWLGVGGGALYALAQAAANVVNKHVLMETEALHVATLRVGIGAMCLLAASAATGALRGLAPLATPAIMKTVIVAALVGTLGGIWLGTLGAQHLPVGIATTLSCTTPLWALALARVTGEAIPPRALVGAALALGGVCVLVVGR